jgi:hypothetical protein
MPVMMKAVLLLASLGDSGLEQGPLRSSELFFLQPRVESVRLEALDQRWVIAQQGCLFRHGESEPLLHPATMAEY